MRFLFSRRINELEAELVRVRHERDCAFESAQRFAEATHRLATEVVRLTQRAAPAAPEGEVEQPKSTRQNDTETVTLESPERAIRPEARPARVE